MKTEAVSKSVIVRYKVKADRLEEHEALVRKVFEALSSVRPPGLAYHALKLEDGLSFLHFATVTTPDGKNPLSSIPAFKAFTANIDDRCDEKPTNATVTALGGYDAP